MELAEYTHACTKIAKQQYGIEPHWTLESFRVMHKLEIPAELAVRERFEEYGIAQGEMNES